MNMSKPKSFTGEYKLDLHSTWTRFTIPTVTVNKNAEFIELSPNGIKTYSTSYDRLISTSMAAVLSVRCASHWMPLKFDCVAILEDGKKLPTFHGVGDSLALPSRMDEPLYQKTLSTLLALDHTSLLFLMRASEMLNSHIELSILNVLFALDLELNHIVPKPRNVAAKLEFLKFAGVISPEALKRLENLNTLRNDLAHGHWDQENLGKSLATLLGGKPKDWLKRDTSINAEAGRRVLNNIILGLGDVLQCGKTLEQLRAHLAKLQQSQTAANTWKPHVPQIDKKRGVP
jgi:hypothetical protein